MSKNPNFRFNGRPPALEDFAQKRSKAKAVIELNLDSQGRPELAGIYHDTIRRFFEESDVLTGLMMTAQTGLQNYMKQASEADVKLAAERGEIIEEGEWVWAVREVGDKAQMQAVAASMRVVQGMLKDLMKMHGGGPRKPGAKNPNATEEGAMEEIEAKYGE